MRSAALALLALAASACDDTTLTVDVSADPPAKTLQSVFVTIDGVNLRRDDGSIETVELDREQQIDLLNFDGDRLFRAIDGEIVPTGLYDGLRLRFVVDDQDDNYVLVSGSGDGRIPLDVGDMGTRFHALSFESREDEGDRLVAHLTLDLRFSLDAPDDDDDREVDEYRLLPAGRAAFDDEEATIEGRVSRSLVESSSCRQGRNQGVGVAVYAFADHDVEPDDFDGLGADPVASAPVQSFDSNQTWSYALRFLPPGRYTLALTCDADIEDGFDDDTDDGDDSSRRGFKFVSDQLHNVEVDDGDTERQNFGL